MGEVIQWTKISFWSLEKLQIKQLFKSRSHNSLLYCIRSQCPDLSPFCWSGKIVSSLCFSEAKKTKCAAGMFSLARSWQARGISWKAALSELDLLMAMMVLLSYAISTDKEKILVGLTCIFYRYCRSSFIPRGSFLFTPIYLFSDFELICALTASKFNTEINC